MAVLLGVFVAFSFGSADFLGGRASRHASTAAVLLLGQAVSVGGAIVVALLVGAHVTGADLGYGAAAGAANVVGLALLYHGLADGRIGVVAPLTAVVGALVPVAWALARGERPSTLVLAGATCAIVAGAFVSREPDDEQGEHPAGSGAAYAIGAGALLGSSLILLAETSDGSGFWPVLAARVSGLVVIGIGVGFFVSRGPVRFPTGGALRFALGAGAFDVTATTLLLVAVRHGLLVVVAPVAALAPAFTVLWAWVVLHEHLGRAQIVGLGLAVIGLALVATG